MPATVNWFEIPVTEFDRAAKFYSKLFGGEVKPVQIGPVTFGFLPAPQGPGAGALAKGPDYVPSKTGALVYLNGGDDLNHVLQKVVVAGGKVLSPKTSIGQHGFVANFEDTEGNKVALHSMK